MKSNIHIVISTLLVLLVFSACEIIDTEFQEIDYETLQISTRVVEPQVIHFNDYESWSMFYRRNYIGITNNNPPVAPGFDFDTNTLVGIFWGEQPSGCSHDIEAVERVERRSNVIRITIGPMGDLGACRMITYPQQYLLLPRRTNHIQFMGELPGSLENMPGS
jgi:hypothetical protein